MHKRTWSQRCIGLLSLAILMTLPLLTTATLEAQVEPQKSPFVAEKAFRHADLDIETENQEIGQLPPAAATQARQRLERLGVNAATARVDQRSGRFVTLLPTTPLVPGRGVGNNLEAAGSASREALEQAAWDAFHDYLIAHQDDLGIDPAELAQHRIASHNDGDLYQIFVPRTFDGIPVRNSHITAVIGQGNLTLFSAHQWADRGRVSNRPQLSLDEAVLAAEDYLRPLEVTREWGKPDQVYVPMASGGGQLGGSYRYVLAWSVKVEVADDGGRWEVLVDAHSGDILANEDQNHYAEAKGGVYPKTNDGVAPDGVEQVGWPMPFMFVGSATTDTGGNYSLTGSQTATFNGPFVNMADNCGTDSLTQSGGIDWGSSGGDDCVTPGFGGAGNTHSSRSGFYELNRIKEMARSHLPSNTWLQNRLTANMNINNTCNAFWNGSTVNFYRSGGGCANTGEIAAVFDHEWAHGMDANDVVGGIASPSGEGIADIYSALRLNDSCIGRNFLSTPCTGNGDPCLTCTGVRDIDYLQRQSGNPHDYSWSNANCGGSVHCVGGVYSEAVWSLWKRKLTAAPYNMDNNTAHEVVTRLTYIGAGVTSTWFSGGPPNGGCSGTSGYMNYLAADDDNGNLNDGTPHMGAIFTAFDDQEIACGTPTVQDSGCAGTPTSAPNVTATPADQAVNLSWGSVSGTTEYQVFRAEGIFNCDFGKVKVAETTGTSFSDTGLQNGRDYSYVVIAKGSSGSCFGPASACDTVQPASAPACVIDADCADGLFCNGTETCNAGTCVAGTSPCTGTEICNETTDTCDPECVVDADCDDGAFCNGAETCNAGSCQAGSDPCPGQSCDEGGDVCTDTNGPQNAVYDSGLGAPACAIAGSSCDSTTLLDSRDTLSPAEPNQPNTLDVCTDGTSGTYHSDESNDRIVVSTLDGLDF
ncbi:MAG: PepSY domain-containing protein, partial [Thermoanaerobaculia bacterium]